MLGPNGDQIYDEEVVKDDNGVPQRNPDGMIAMVKVAKTTWKFDPIGDAILRLFTLYGRS
jgi:hypothetical protein